ncbi:hypothetical protein AB6U14_07000 [Klebsiella pneumoniae]
MAHGVKQSPSAPISRVKSPCGVGVAVATMALRALFRRSGKRR